MPTPVPDVSVVVPSFNRAHCLGASLESLLRQRDVDLEVIVVDDGSTDGTAEMLAAAPDARVRVLVRPHEGIASARNAGVAAARAAFIAFHDSDDLALPGRLAVPVTHLRADPACDLVIQNGRLLPPEGRETPRGEPTGEPRGEPRAAPTGEPTGEPAGEPWIAPAVARRLAAAPVGVAEVFRWNLGQLQGMCFTRRSLEAVGPFDTSLDILDDLDLVLRVAVRFRGVFLDVPAFAYRRHPGGVARNRVKVREEAIRVAERLVREHPEALALVGPAAFALRQARRHARLAAMRARTGDLGGARAALARAETLRPRWLGRRVHDRLRLLWLALRARR
jgi:GT2 family glycosyltransferase